MGQIINPISYRLGKTKFWKYVWCFKSKKIYKKMLNEDLNLKKFMNWLFSVLNWRSIGIVLSNFNVIKNYNYLTICIYFFLRRLKIKKIFLKKNRFKFRLKNKFLRFFILKLLNKKRYKFRKKTKTKRSQKRFKKDQKIVVNKFLKKRSFFKRKRKRWKKKHFFLLCVLFFRYLKFFIKKNAKFRLYYKKFLSYFYYKKLFKKFYYSSVIKKPPNKFIKAKPFRKALMIKKFNYRYFLKLLSSFLSFFIKKIFKISNVLPYFMQKKDMFVSGNFLKKLTKLYVQKNRNKVSLAIKKLIKKIKKKKYLVGFKIGFFGRYEKRLRNKKVLHLKGSLSPSNINTPLSYKSFFILLKQGLCGIKITYLIQLKKNEIFKKKTFISKAS